MQFGQLSAFVGSGRDGQQSNVREQDYHQVAHVVKVVGKRNQAINP